MAAGLVLVLAAAAAGGCAAATSAPATRPVRPQLMIAGIAEDPCRPQRVLPVAARLGGQFEPDSSILRIAGGVYAAPGRPAPLTRAESACAEAA
jgi:hypothetical protein